MSEYTKDTIKLLIDDLDVTQYVKSYEIEECYFKGPDSFKAKMDPGFSINLVTQPHYYQWLINGYPVQYGIVDKDEIRGSKNNGIESTIEGHDLLKILTTNYCINDTPYGGDLITVIKSFLNANTTINSIYSWEQKRKLLRNGSEDVVLDLFEGLPQSSFIFEISPAAQDLIDTFEFNFIKPNLGETLWDFITKLTNQIGLVIKHKPDESLTLQIYKMYEDIGDYNEQGTWVTDPVHYYIQNRIPNISPDAAVQLNNVLDFDFKEDIDNFSLFVKLIGNIQNDDIPSIFKLRNLSTSLNKIPYGKKAGISKPIYKVEGLCSYIDKPGSFDVQVPNIGYQGLPKFRTISENQIDQSVWQINDSREQIINNVMINQMRELYKLKYTLVGHSGKFFSDGGLSPYTFNRLCTINDDYLQLSNSDFLISEVKYKGSKTEGQTTIVDLVIYKYQSSENFRGYNGKVFLPSPPIRVTQKATTKKKAAGTAPESPTPADMPFISVVGYQRGNAEAPGPVTTLNATTPAPWTYNPQQGNFVGASPGFSKNPVTETEGGYPYNQPLPPGWVITP